MKKIFILCVLFLALFCGCDHKSSSSRDVVDEGEKQVVEDTSPTLVYQDENPMPIGIYQLKGNRLTKLHQITITPVVEEDIGIFQLYPSSDEEIILEEDFGSSFYHKWLEYNPDNKIKMGFNIKFHLSTTGEDVSYNMFSPNDTMLRWEHLMNYLYDDYANLGKSFYSHIENEEYTDSTLFTSIKLQNSYQVHEIDSKIELTVFTYDSEDDFLENQEYRGNSSYTFDICIQGFDC